jgi:hypothetical protein
VLGIGLASLLSDTSHEIATTILPAFLAAMGAAAAWLGLIEGLSDGLSSFAKMGSGYFTDQMRRRKPIAVFGYVLTTVGTACFGLATQAWHVLLCRAGAWFGRGVRTPVRKALLSAASTPQTYGRAFGFERMNGYARRNRRSGFCNGSTGRREPSLPDCVLLHTHPGLGSSGGHCVSREGKGTGSCSVRFVWRTIERAAQIVPPFPSCGGLVRGG